MADRAWFLFPEETWTWIEHSLQKAYKEGRENEAIECQKDLERTVKEEREYIFSRLPGRLDPVGLDDVFEIIEELTQKLKGK